MSGCALRRWGPGTTCERPVDTPAAKEMAARLAAMQAARAAQDSAWSGPVALKAEQTSVPNKSNVSAQQQQQQKGPQLR
jgi:hypothetical protein